MIESINDLLSLSIIILLVAISGYFVVITFSKHHARRIMEFENEYYDYNDDDISDDEYI